VRTPSASTRQSRSPVPETDNTVISFGTCSLIWLMPENRIASRTVTWAERRPSPTPTSVCTSEYTRAACFWASGISRCQVTASEPVDGRVPRTTRRPRSVASDDNLALAMVKSSASLDGTPSSTVVAPDSASGNWNPEVPSVVETATASSTVTVLVPGRSVTSVYQPFSSTIGASPPPSVARRTATSAGSSGTRIQ
jgi:hypothetical protein